MQERTIEKRIAYKNILLNSMINENIDYDEIEEFQRIAERLMSYHIFILDKLIIASYQNINYGSERRSKQITISLRLVLLKIILDWDDEKLIDSLARLEDERLIKDFTKDYKKIIPNKFYILKERITEKGVRFHQFITDPNS